MKMENKHLINIVLLFIPVYLIKFSIYGIRANLLEVLIIFVFIIYLFQKKCFPRQFFQRHKVVSCSILVILAGLFISTFHNNNWQVGLGIIKGWFILPIMLGWVVYEKTKTEEDLKAALKWLYFGILGVAIISLAYFLEGNLTYDKRLRAFYLSPNHLAMYLAPGIIIGLYLIKSVIFKNQSDNNKLKNICAYVFYAASLNVIIASFYLTYSYMAWLAVVLGLMIAHLVKNEKINKQIILIAIIIILLMLVSQWNTEKFANLREFTQSSLESRIIIWKSALKILKDSPFFGIGPGNFQNKYLEYQKHFPPYLEWAVPQPHNLYLAFWLQSGMLGMAGFLLLIIKWLAGIMIRSKNSQEAEVLLGILFYVLIHGLADTPYWKNDLAVVFWIVLALGLTLMRRRNVLPDGKTILAKSRL